MRRKLVTTEDGSQTFYVPALGEHYHSIHGAITESQHIFIDAAFNTCSKKSIRVLELGFGTGLNALLTFIESFREGKEVYYHTIEKYPLVKKEYSGIQLPDDLKTFQSVFFDLHESPWQKKVKIREGFSLYKEENDFRQFDPELSFDVIYFDAFSPEVQPELWSKEIFCNLFAHAEKDAVLTTYSSKGTVKRNLRDAGFSVEKLPGPPGKREITRARKLPDIHQ